MTNPNPQTPPTEQQAKREPWDHGTANQAIEFILHHHQAPGEETEFLRAWQHGDLGEWPEFYEWLDRQAHSAPVVDGAASVRQIALDAIKEMRRTGESHEMCARWISERVSALSAPASAGVREKAQAVVDCFGVGYGTDYARFVEAITPFILSLRAALSASPPPEQEVAPLPNDRELVERVRKDLFGSLCHYRQRCINELDDAQQVVKFIEAEIASRITELSGGQEGWRGIYIASRASVPERSATWRAYRDQGVPIVSSWIDEAGESETGCFTELWDRITREIAGAERLVLYAESDDFPLKGALIEAGIAIGMGKPVTVCLPGVNLSGRTHRPIGSWIQHRLVTRNDDIASALTAPPSTDPDGGSNG